MSRISSLMNIGSRAMANSQTGLQTVSHNIANKDTEGYSRQRVEQATSTPVGRGKLRMGMGAYTKAVSRTTNPFLEKQIQKESMVLGYGQSKSDNMTRVEQIFNEQISKGLNRFISDFFNAFRELANNPESLATRTMVKEAGDFLAKDMARIVRQLKDIQQDIDNQVRQEVADINEMAEELATLNERIKSVELTGAQANDARDRRDLLLKKLGEKVDIRWGEGTDGQVTVTAGKTAVIVSGFESARLDVQDTGENGKKRSGNVDVVFQQSENGSKYVVTEQFVKGKLGGALEVRDTIVNGLLNDLDEMAYGIAERVNNIHRQGYNIYSQNGVDFFKLPLETRDAAGNLHVSDAVASNVGFIAAGLTPGAPGDNRIANAIADVQQQKFLSDSTSSLDDFYNSMVGRVAIQTRKANNLAEHQSSIVNQLSNFRESLSGVSLDEEAVKLINYQKTFDASARLIKTSDEMLETVLNLKRL
jgi:flagellar hook-associated protein 1 FlgK